MHLRRGQTPDQALGRGELLPAVAAREVLDQAGALDPEPGGAQRVVLALQEAQGLLADGEGPFALAAEPGGDGGLGHQVEIGQGCGGVPAAGGVHLGVVDGAQRAPYVLRGVVPQLQRPFQQA